RQWRTRPNPAIAALTRSRGVIVPPCRPERRVSGRCDRRAHETPGQNRRFRPPKPEPRPLAPRCCVSSAWRLSHRGAWHFAYQRRAMPEREGGIDGAVLCSMQPLPLNERLDRIGQHIVRARLFLDLWFYFEEQHSRSKIIETME